MTLRFRIKPVAPLAFVVQEKGRFFWHTVQDSYYGWDFDKSFASKDDAKAYIDAQIAKAYRDAEQLVATKLHLSQAIEEYPA